MPVAALSSNVFGTRYELSLDASVHPFEGAAPAGAGGAGAGGSWLGAPRRDKPQELASVLYKTKLRGFMRPRRCGPGPARWRGPQSRWAGRHAGLCGAYL